MVLILVYNNLEIKQEVMRGMNIQVLEKLSQVGKINLTEDYSVMFHGKKISLDEYLVSKEQESVKDFFNQSK